MMEMRNSGAVATALRRAGAWVLLPAFLLVFCFGNFAGFVGFDFGLTAAAAPSGGGAVYMGYVVDAGVVEPVIKVDVPAGGFSGANEPIKALILTNAQVTGNTYTALAAMSGTDYLWCSLSGDATPLNGETSAIPVSALDTFFSDTAVQNEVYVYLYYGDQSPSGMSMFTPPAGIDDDLIPHGSVTFTPDAPAGCFDDLPYQRVPVSDLEDIFYWPNSAGLTLDTPTITVDGNSTPYALISLFTGPTLDAYYAYVPTGTGAVTFYQNALLPMVLTPGSADSGTAAPNYSVLVDGGDAVDVNAAFGLSTTATVFQASVVMRDGSSDFEFAYQMNPSYSSNELDADDIAECFPRADGKHYMDVTYRVVYAETGTGALQVSEGIDTYHPDGFLFSGTPTVKAGPDSVSITVPDLHFYANNVKYAYTPGSAGGIKLAVDNWNAGDDGTQPLAHSQSFDVKAFLQSSAGKTNLVINAPNYQAKPRAEQVPDLSWENVVHGSNEQEPPIWFVSGVIGPGSGPQPLGYRADFEGVASDRGALVSAIPTISFDTGTRPRPNPDNNDDYTPSTTVPPTTAPVDNKLYDPLDQIEVGLADVSRASSFSLIENADGTSTLIINLSDAAILQADEDGYKTYMIDLEGSDLDISGIDPTKLHFQVNVPQSAAGTIKPDSTVRVNSGTLFTADIPWSEVNPVDERVEITVEISDINLPLPGGVSIGSGSFSMAAYAARRVGATTRNVASSAYNISVTKINTTTMAAAPVTTFKTKPVIVSIPQNQVRVSTVSMGTTSTRGTPTLVAKKYNEDTKTWDSRPTMVQNGKVTFFSNTLSTFAIFETYIEAEDIDETYDNIEVISFLLEAGIIQGTDEGNVAPYSNARLNELAAMLVRMDSEPVEKFATEYPGVLETRWFYNDLNAALNRGYISEEETVKDPDKWVTVGESVRMLFRYKSRHSGGIIMGDNELEDALQYALATGLYGEKMFLNLGGTVTREEVFLALFKLFLDLYGGDEA